MKLFEIEPIKIRDAHVDMTIMNGAVIYNAVNYEQKQTVIP